MRIFLPPFAFVLCHFSRRTLLYTANSFPLANSERKSNPGGANRNPVILATNLSPALGSRSRANEGKNYALFSRWFGKSRCLIFAFSSSIAVEYTRTRALWISFLRRHEYASPNKIKHYSRLRNKRISLRGCHITLFTVSRFRIFSLFFMHSILLDASGKCRAGFSDECNLEEQLCGYINFE